MKKLLAIIVLLNLMILSGCMNKEYTGVLSSSGKTCDEMFGVEVEAPILIRTVEMVQYYSGENGVELVFSNQKIDSIEGCESPAFPSGLVSAIFYDPLMIDGYQLSDAIVRELAYGDLLEKKTLTDLPDLIENDHDLIKVDGAYVSRSDDWQPGEIRVTYSYIDSTELKIKGSVKDGILDTNRYENVQLATN